MDRYQIIVDIVKPKQYCLYNKEYCYPSIPNKIKSKLIKNFDSTLNTNNIGVFSDVTLTSNCKNGIIFMLHGFYYKQVFEKTVYINYFDIEQMDVIPSKKGEYDSSEAELRITLKNGTKFKVGFGDYKKETLKTILEELIDATQEWNKYTPMISGVISKIDISDTQKSKCHAIIHTAAGGTAGVGAGLSQLPGSDNAAITPIQIGMITSLAAVFDIRITEGAAKGLLSTFATAFVGRGISQFVVGWIPGMGNVINATTAAGITEAIGWMAVKHFFELQQQDRAKHRVDGIKAGYVAASDEYEEKLRIQAEEFIKQKEIAKDQFDEYQKLISEYESYIESLEQKDVQNTAIIDELRRVLDELKGVRVST